MIRETIDILTQGNADEALLNHLEGFIDQYPYSSTMHLLLARAAKLNESPKFEDVVRQAAIRTQNRKQLHEFVYSETNNVFAEQNKAPNREPDHISEVTHESAQTEIDHNSVLETVENELLSSENDTTSIDQEVETQNEGFDIDTARIEALEKQFISEMLAAGGAIELLNSEDEIEEEIYLAQKIRQQNTSNKIELNSEQSELQETQDFEDSTEFERKSIVAPEKLSLSGWLQFLDENEPNEISNQVEIELNKVQTEGTKPPAMKDAKEVSDIISNFIQNEAQIVPKRAEFYSPAKAAKNSLMDKESYVTETLANVYAAQGNISKAISTYEKLSLLHPEKSAYFAAFIKKLKRQL